MALSPEDKTDLEAMVLDAVAKITAGVSVNLERYLRGQLLNMQADLDLAIDKLEILDHQVSEIKTVSMLIRRDQMKDVRRAETEHERGVYRDTEMEAFKFQLRKLAERVDAFEKGR